MSRNSETSSRPVQKRQSVRSGLAWMFSSQGVLSILHVVVLMALARLLSPAEFGVATVFLAIAQICAIVSTMGFGPALVQSQETTARHVAAALNIALLGGLLFGSGIYLCRQSLADLLGMQDQAGLFWMFIPWCCASGMNLVLRSVMQKERRFRSLSMMEAGFYLFAYSLPAIFLAWRGYGALSLVVASTVSASLNTLVCFVLLRPAWSWWVDFRAARELSRTGLGFGLSELISISTQGVDKLLVSGLLGTAAVGLYGRASSLMQTGLSMLSAPLDAVMFPTFSQAQHNLERMRELLRKTHVLVFLLALPVALLMVCVPDGLILILLGSDWMEASPLLQIYGVLIVIRVNSRAVDFVLRAKGLVYHRLALIVVFSICTIVFITWGAGHGLIGVATGVTMAFLFHALLLCWLVVTKIKMAGRDFLSLVLRPLLWAVVTGGGLISMMHGQWMVDRHPVLKLVIAGILILGVMGACLWFRPGMIFGQHGGLARSMVMEQARALGNRLTGRRRQSEALLADVGDL